MEDVKDKMKGLIKKVNKPFSSSSSAFKGQGRVLGSATSSSTPSNSTSSRLLPPPRPSVTATKSPAGFAAYEPVVTSSERSASAAATFECPICSSSFPSEESVSDHLDSCMGPSADAGSGTGVVNGVGGFLSGEPAEASVEIVVKLLRNLTREPGNEKFRKIRMGNPRIKEAIGDAVGGLELLECVGFRIQEEDGEKWATMGEPTRERIAVIQEAVSLLERWKVKDAAAAQNGTMEKLVPEKESEQKSIDRKFVSSALKDPTLEFELLSPAMSRVHAIPRFRGADGRTPTLEEESLVPSALIKFKPIETDSIVFTGLANEFLELIEPLTGAATVP
ncbi:hypothetical protein KFK09_008966 [Dendrobium nobile]|uniref:PUB domain-containing protein n=1 Tax=Dendrobium nobile TaxID=94219 RepID=A0A8T3BLJ3_DENNO|nr:hypothetical protein KFK09_008966 [Dendrobium nobile]